MSSPALAHAKALAADLPAHTADHEAHKRLALPVVSALVGNGLLDLLLPRELGGSEVSPADYVEVLEVLAAGDAATAWCVMTASTSTLLAAYLPRDGALQIWNGTPQFLAGVFAPGGKAIAEGEGVRLTGRWPFASGCRHASWFALGALSGAPPKHIICIVPSDAVTIVDNWETLGLPGTGSHDAVVEGVLVPTARIGSVFEARPWTEGVLSRVPLFGLLALGIAAVGLGIARGALEHLAARLAPKPGAEPPPGAVLGSYARLSGRLAAARAHLDATARTAHERALADRVDPACRAELRIAACLVAEECAAIGRAAFHLGGGASIRAGSPLGRALRDLETVLSHRMVGDRVMPAAGRALLGLGAAPDL
jgi:alkylation response protein AidB-like acyl-CoA dehydrogenase